MDEKENSQNLTPAAEQNHHVSGEENVASGDLFAVLQEEKTEKNGSGESLKAEDGAVLQKAAFSGNNGQEWEKEEDPGAFQAQLLPGTTCENLNTVEEEKEKTLEEAVAPSSVKKEEEKKIDLRRYTGRTLGQLLVAARTEKGMSIEDVSAVTLIREEYIKALEGDLHEKLPPIIFVKAYVRSLISFYGVDEPSSDMLKELLSDLEPVADVPEKVVDELNKNVQINEEEARKVQLTGYYLLGSLAFLLIFIISLVIYFTVVKGKNVQKEESGSAVVAVSVEDNKTEGIPGKKFDASELSRLIPQIIPEERLFPLPAKRKRN